MPARCLVCSHPNRDQINESLVKLKQADTAVAGQYGLNREAVRRHRINHLGFSTKAASESHNARTIIRFASELYERSLGVLKQAEATLVDSEGSPRAVQAASASLREVRQSIELLARLVVSEPDPTEGASKNAALDLQIAEAIARLEPPALPAGPQLPGGIEEAELVPE
jgi:hypothetical protein